MKTLWKILLVMVCVALPLGALAEEGALTMPEPYASATFTDPSAIPYPDNRDENGYLTEGEFVHEDDEAGLWAYLSPTLQVQIVRYEGNWDKFNQRWFIAEVKFDPSKEMFDRHTWYVEDVTGMGFLGKLQRNGVTRGDIKDQAIWPKTLAQADRMVLAVNGDFYLGRASKNQATGNILRQGKVLYDVNPKKKLSFPNLDSAAFFSDGSIKVFDHLETTATEQLQAGARNMVSFGPWLIRDGVARELEGDYVMQREPRLAIGMVEPGHFIIVDCEGRVPSNRGNGARGLNLIELRDLLYYNGVQQAINMDGGNTSVLIFMGEKLNLTGLNDIVGSPRNQNELFGVGKSELVRTDWVNGKP